MNTSFSLHKITNKNVFPFNPESYSWFKFGDTEYAEKFAIELFNKFIDIYGDQIINQEEIILLPSPYLSIPTASNYLCYFFKKQLNLFLSEHGKKACLESKIYRNQTYVVDYGNLDFEQRVNLISNDTYYIDKNIIEGKFCIFVDDIKITGSHEFTVNKILKQYKVSGNHVFVYFAELTNKEIHPNIENFYNYYAVKNIEAILEVMQREHFKFNTRIIKYILNLNKKDFDFLIKNTPQNKINDLFHLAISNNYHQIDDYKSNINIIKEIKQWQLIYKKDNVRI